MSSAEQLAVASGSSYTVVTSCSKAGWEKYGERMVRSMVQHWPSSTRILLYAEGFSVPADLLSRVEVRSLPAWQETFKARHMSNQAAHGRSRNGRYDFKMDAVRFSHKTGAVIDAAEHQPIGRLLWVDADTLTHSPVSLGFLDDLFRGMVHIAWLDRASMYPECGFYALDMRSETVMELIADWRRMYETDEVFRLREWHDSYVLEQLVKVHGLQTHSLSGEARTHSHPLINGPLGAVMDHMKGPRKDVGRSARGDLRTPRSEEYWK